MPVPPKEFGRRNPRPRIEPPPIVYHAPQGLDGEKPPHDKRRLRSIAVFLGVFGLATVYGLALVEAIRSSQCRKADPNDPDAPACQSSGGHGGGGGGHSSGSGGASHSSASFGGFGGTGEGGAHGGGHGGGE